MSEAAIGLAGILIGVLATHGFSILSENRRWRREDRHRFLDDRKRYYSFFLLWTQEVFLLCPGDERKRHEALREASSYFYGIEIVAPDAVREAARKLLDTTLDISKYSERVNDYERGWSDARESFKDSARNDLRQR